MGKGPSRWDERELRPRDDADIRHRNLQLPSRYEKGVRRTLGTEVDGFHNVGVGRIENDILDAPQCPVDELRGHILTGTRLGRIPSEVTGR